VTLSQEFFFFFFCGDLLSKFCFLSHSSFSS
jgi:hypothetical protein